MSNQELAAAGVRERLGLGEDAMPWLSELEAVGAPPDPVALPAPADARELLASLAAPSTQVDEVMAARPSEGRDPALWWLLERCQCLLVREMGSFGYLRSWPPLPAGLGAPGRYLYVWAFLATLGEVRRFQRERGIPDDVAWATLADLGRNMEIHERMYGVGGLSAQNWLTLHFRGAIYQLGRLQFNRSRIGYAPAVLEALGAGYSQDEPSLGVHIPETGPLAPEGCDASFRWARDFFDHHFPEDRCRIATCGSWLLDAQLAEYMAPSSNIIRFQRRFHLLPGGRVCDEEIVRFVFRRADASLGDLPRRTSLERAIVQHLRAGRHWLARTGWVEL